MITVSTLHRRSRVAATALVAALALTACGSNGGSDDDADTTSAVGFPVTVDTEFGELALGTKPEQIVVVGSPLDVDMLEALGEPADVFGMGSTEEVALGIAPWDEGLYGEYVEGLFDNVKPVTEAIAAQDPDLIIYFGAGAPLDQSGHDQLSEIAPTYAYTEIPAWQEEIATLSQLTGTTDRADAVTDEITEAFADARRTLPGLEGKTYFQGVATPDGLYSIPGVEQFFSALGMTPSDMQATTGPETISLENLDRIDADVFLLGGDGEPRDAVTDDPRFDELPAVRNGTMIQAQPLFEQVAFPSQIGPSSVPWFLDRLVPELEKSTLNEDG